MWGVFSVGGLILAGLIVAAVCVAVVVLRSRRSGRRGETERDPAASESRGRLAWIESTPVDADRRLVLVRCDNVEHLIMVGGPTDLVIENDVRKQRQPARPAPRPAVHAEPAAHSEPAPFAAQPRPALPAPAEEPAAEAQRPAAMVPPPVHPANRGNHPDAAAQEPPVRPAARNGQAGPIAAPVRLPAAEENRRAEPQPVRPAATLRLEPEPGRPNRPRQDAEPNVQRLDPPNIAAARRAGPMQPTPHGGNQGGEPLRISPGPRDLAADDRRMPAARGSDPVQRQDPVITNLPSAEVPWPQADSIENEIVRALRVEPSPPLSAGGGTAPPQLTAPQAHMSEKQASHAGTTLGDLAERLEEALAREVQLATDRRGAPEFDVDAFAFDREQAEPAAPQPRRPDPAPVMAPVPQAEPRRDLRAQDRHEEAPVISLNARRQAAADPLEDEMARLLGELTGDTGRR